MIVTRAGRQIVETGQRIVDQVHTEVLASLPAGLQAPFADGLTALASGLLAEPVEGERPVRRARQSVK